MHTKKEKIVKTLRKMLSSDYGLPEKSYILVDFDSGYARFSYSKGDGKISVNFTADYETGEILQFELDMHY